jgi:hypothetical protein
VCVCIYVHMYAWMYTCIGYLNIVYLRSISCILSYHMIILNYPHFPNNASDDSTEMLFSKEKQEIEKEKIKNEKKEKERLRKKKASLLNIAAVSALSNSINFCDAAAPVGMCKYVALIEITFNFRFEQIAFLLLLMYVFLSQILMVM